MPKKKFAKNKVHFIGIGGIGMSALAQWFLAQKWLVSGSDLVPSSITDGLAIKGVKVKIGHKKENLEPGTSLVVYTAAVSDDNPEILEARRRGIEVERYSQTLGGLTRAYTTFAVSGTHGKTTTTALLSLALIEGGMDPSVIIGTKLNEFEGSNFRLGKGSYLVIEADEWAASFLDYSPTALIITNIDREHLDFYKNFTNVKKNFLKLISNFRKNGTSVLVVNGDDPVLSSMKEILERLASGMGVKVVWYSLANPLSAKIKKSLKIFGEHNVSNALAAYTLSRELKVSHGDILRAFRRYGGAWRRMEYRGQLRILKTEKQKDGKTDEISVYDDYAHHPAEIRATLRAFKEKFPRRALICVFQPHQAERLKLLYRDFVSAFILADVTVLLPVYKVAGRDEASRGRTSKSLTKEIQKKYPKQKVLYLDNPEAIRGFLKDLILKELINTPLPPIIIMMGAGDIVNYTDEIIG